MAEGENKEEQSIVTMSEKDYLKLIEENAQLSALVEKLKKRLIEVLLDKYQEIIKRDGEIGEREKVYTELLNLGESEEDIDKAYKEDYAHSDSQRNLAKT